MSELMTEKNVKMDLPVATSQQDVEKKETKAYELRPLVASDMGAICKIITEIGIRQFKECFDVEQVKAWKDEDIEKIGFSVLFDIAGIIISNIPKAEESIQEFLASLTGMECVVVRNIPFADYGEMIIDVVTKKEFQDFFKRVMKLFNR